MCILVHVERSGKVPMELLATPLVGAWKVDIAVQVRACLAPFLEAGDIGSMILVAMQLARHVFWMLFSSALSRAESGEVNEKRTL